MKHLRVITWCRWRHSDAFDDRFSVSYTASVLSPSYEYPIPCLSMSVVTAAGRIFVRFATIEALEQLYVVPGEYRDRLIAGYNMGLQQSEQIREHLRMIMHAKGLEPGASIVRTDTGEIIAEAERIMRDGNAT